MNFVSKAVVYLRMIKFSHTIFALPFALSSAVLVHREYPITTHSIFWIIMAMVGARSAAMGFNRIVDASIDSRNSRTAGREIPNGTISRYEAIIFVILSSAWFIIAAAMLSPLCFLFSFPVLALLFGYSYTKRFTWLSHIILGLAIGMVPMAVWVAVTGSLSWKITVLCLVLLTYIAGFDILYACQDVGFDTRENLYSIPRVFGIEKSLAISRLLHCFSTIAVFSLYWLFPLSPIYFIFAGLITVLFIIEHTLVNPDDISKIEIAFFHVNSIISIMIFVAISSGSLLWGVI